MTKGCSFLAVMLVMVLVCNQMGASEAATCNASQLSPCLGALRSGSAPSQDCCARLKGQQSCLCGYMKDPNMKQYVNSPNARKVVGQCGVTLPNC
ncbi:Non-specific lipid-transfer protein 2 [Capsicum baccatum]|uniref:Non-specific lipid-transfer protein 2 n=1 Tax=Capsicum baccatum TaxID=33114 RepID=A0A2G2XGN5_CAPBA|nr:Non-specific lipid-transfer protein 2 [Capsicum baccatum]